MAQTGWAQESSLVSVWENDIALPLETFTPPIILRPLGDSAAGKTTVAMRMTMILHQLSYGREGHLVAVTGDKLVGQYIVHTAP